MKYEDSQRFTITLAAAGTAYSAWFNVGFANEIYAYCTYDWLKAIGNDESATVSLQRHIPLAADVAAEGTDVLTFSTRTADNAVEEKIATDKDEAAQGTENRLGMRMRFELVATGTDWTTDQTITVVCIANMKRN